MAAATLVALVGLVLGFDVPASAPHRFGVLGATTGSTPSGIRPLAPLHARLDRQVYGYLPWWQLDSTTAGSLRYDLLTTIALFGVGIEATGDLDTASPGYLAYLGPDARAVIDAAHAKGVRVVPTFHLLDSGNLRDLRAFLGTPAAQQRFIRQAIALVAARSADGANLDLEPVPDALAGAFASFVSRFGRALRRSSPDATLVVALGAGASGPSIAKLVPLVDQLFIMGYDYRTSASGNAGPVAPLGGPAQVNVRADLARFLRWAPPGKLILGMPVYGYDWPVESTNPGAAVRSSADGVGAPFAVTFAAIGRFLARHPGLPVSYDPVAETAFFTYHDHDTGTYRQVWFDNARSLGRKVDLALSSRLAGVGLWTLDGGPGFSPVWDLLHHKLQAPSHAVTVRGSLFHLASHAGVVTADITASVRNTGTVPEAGQLGWVIRDPAGRVVASGHVALSLDPQRPKHPLVHVTLGRASQLPSGTYRLTLVYGAGGRHWAAPATSVRQPY
jgi:spore germination protein